MAVAVLSVRFLVAAVRAGFSIGLHEKDKRTRSALAIAVYPAPYASWPQPMWILWPFQVVPFFQVTAYPVAPCFRREPSVNTVSPGRSVR